MQRRTFLATLGASATLAGAGCVGSGDDGPTDRTTTGGSRTPTPTTTVDHADILSSVSCPTFSADADRSICSTTADPSSVPVLLDPQAPPVLDPTTGDDSVGTLRFALTNRGSSGFLFNPQAWALKRQTEDGWEHVAPDSYPDPLQLLASGRAFIYSLAVDAHPAPSGAVDRQIRAALDAGVHALVVEGFFQDSNDRIECVALFVVA